MSQFQQFKQLLMPYKFAMDELETKINIMNEEAYLNLTYNPIEHVKTRLKNPESILKKLERKGISFSVENAREHLYDIAGVRILCSFEEDIYLIFNMLTNRPDFSVVTVKDYVQQPKPNGYRSLHLIVEVPVVLRERVKPVYAEIQIRTLAMDFWASLEHKIFYKYGKEVPDYIRQELLHASEAVKGLDGKMSAIRKEIDTLEQTNEQIMLPG